MMMHETNTNFRRRMGAPIDTTATRARFPEQGINRIPSAATSAIWRLSRLYCALSALAAVLAIITAQSGSFGNTGRVSVFFDTQAPEREHEHVENVSKDDPPHVINLETWDWSWLKESVVSFTAPPEKDLKKGGNNKLPPWLRWLSPQPQLQKPSIHSESTALSRVLTRALALLQSFLDPGIYHPSPKTLTDLIDKVITSTPRLLAIANLLLSLTFLLHTAVADWFLGAGLRNSNEWVAVAGRERLGGFLVFKLLLISAVVAPDTLDLLILLSWYTLLSFLRSLSHLCAGTTQHTIQSGQPPRAGVLKLLLAVLFSDFLAAAVCVALFHGAGWGMVLLLTCDCALLAIDVICHILLHVGQVLEAQHNDRVSVLEARQMRFHQRAAMDEDEAVLADARQLDRRLEMLEHHQLRRMAILESTVFALQLFTHILTVGHFVHIWSLHGVQFTLIDGVLALHLHSALSSASKKISERRNLHRIARDMDGLFDDATELELRKAAATGDVCCICLGTMTMGNVKKVGCGHLYHTNCLREVIERARSMEAARCPLCRASIMDGHCHNRALRSTRGGAVNAVLDRAPMARVGEPTQNTGGERPLFRFSTEGIVPTWLPVPAFSFEVVRRNVPLQADGNANNANNGTSEPRQSLLRRLLIMAGVIPMSPEEEAAALEQLVDMFPQYDRADLLRELRRRGSSEAVAESILLGVFAGAARAGENWPGNQ